MDRETILLDYEERLRAAMLVSDVEKLDALIADDLAFVGPDGQIASKEQDLEAHRSGAVRFESIHYGERSTRLLGCGALTIVRADLVVSVAGRRIEGPYRYLRVWRIDPDGWRIVGGQVSAIPSS